MPPVCEWMMLIADLLLRHLGDLVLQRLERAGDVGLEDDVELLDLALLGAREDLLEADLARLAAGQRLGLQPVGALLGELAGAAVVLDRADVLAGLADAVEAEHLDRHPGPGLLDALAGEVVHRPHPAPLRAGDEGVADLQRAALDEDRDDGAAAGVELGLDHRARGGGVGVGAQLLQLGDEQDHVEQVVEALVGLGGDVAVDRLPSPVLGGEPVGGELVADPVGLRALFVDLVDRDQDRHVGGAGVVDRLLGLRHDAVVGGDDDDGDVGDLGAAGAHRREGGVAGGVEEGDRLLVVVDLVGADVLGDAARLAGGDLGLADRVEQRGLAVVDVAHDRHHRRRGRKALLGVLELRRLRLLVGGGDDLDLAVVLVGDRLDRLVGEGLGERRHLPHRHQLLDHLGAAQPEQLGDLAHGRAGVDLGRLGLGRRLGFGRRLLQQRPAPAPTAPPRRALRRRAAHLVAAGSLRVDHDTPFFRPALAAGARVLLRAGPAFRPRRWRAVSPALGRRRLGGRLGLLGLRLRGGGAAPPPEPEMAFSASDSSTLEAAAFASMPAAFSAASSSLLLTPWALAIS